MSSNFHREHVVNLEPDHPSECRVGEQDRPVLSDSEDRHRQPLEHHERRHLLKGFQR